MKQPKTPLLTLFILALATLLPSCGGSTEQDTKTATTENSPSSDHVKYLPEDAWMVSTIRLGQLMEKMDYDNLVHMPAIATLYSLSGELHVDVEDKRQRKLAVYMTRMIEDPGMSGIDLDRDAYFFLGSPQKQTGDAPRSRKILPSIGFVLPLSDRDRFENLVELLLKESGEVRHVTRRSDKNMRHYSHEGGHEDGVFNLLAVHDDFAYLQLAVTGEKSKDYEVKAAEVKEHLTSPTGPPAFIEDMLDRPFDVALHLDFDGMMNTLKPIIHQETNGELDALLESPVMNGMKSGSESIELTAENGRLVLTERATLGNSFKYDLVGPAVRNSMLDLLPADSIASASISLNMEGIRTMLLDFQKALGSELSDDLDLPPLDMQIPGLGLSIDEVLSAFSGEITAALINLPDHDAPHPQSDVPEFVLALSTVDPASKVYQDILKKKLLSLFDKVLRQELLEQTGISLVAKDNRLIIGSHGQAAVLKAGKAPKPVGSDERKLLSGGYLNLHVDAEPIAKAMEKEFGRNRRGIDHGLKGEMEYLETQLSEDSNLSPAEADSIVGNIAALREELARMSSNSRPLRPEEQFTVDAFKRMEGFTLQATKQGETYLAEVALSLNDKKSNVLKQTGSFIGNFMDPAWRDPEMRPRIEAARKLAAKDPEAFRESLVGAWKDEWEDEWEVETASESNGTFGEVPPEQEPQLQRSHGVNKYLNRADGTFLREHLGIEPEGYYLEEDEGSWKVHGNSLLEYDEHGLLEWVGGLLKVTPEKHDFYSIGEPFREYDVLSNPRVPLDWQLPDPPKGLPKLEREIYDEDRDFDVLLPQSRRELDLIEESAGENLVVRQEGTPPKSYEIQELITNLSGPVKTRFLSVDLVAQGTAPNFEKVMEENDFRIRHEALKVLGRYKYEDTQQDAFMERVNVDLMKRFASVLQKHSRGGRNFITKLYFTEFVVQ